MTDEITYEQAVNAVKMVQQLHDLTGKFFDLQGLDPNINSIVARELQTFIRPKPLFTAYSQGSCLIDIAADHLIAFTKTITEPAQSVAPWTITRSVLEASALSSWLLDTKINSQERVRRSFALRYEGLSQEAKFIHSIGQTTEIVHNRIEEMELIAEELGFSKLRNKKDERIGIGEIMPYITEIIRDTLNEESNYRLYSAMAHSHHWAYTQLSYRKVDEMALQEDNTVLVEKHLSVELVWWLCVNITHYFSQPIKYKCELYGYDIKEMKNIIDDVFTGIGGRPKNVR